MLCSVTDKEVDAMYSLYESCITKQQVSQIAVHNEQVDNFDTIYIAQQQSDMAPEVRYRATVTHSDINTTIGELGDGNTVHLTKLDEEGNSYRVVFYNSDNQVVHEFVSSTNIVNDFDREITVTDRRIATA